jgi:hypothetical protein
MAIASTAGRVDEREPDAAGCGAPTGGRSCGRDAMSESAAPALPDCRLCRSYSPDGCGSLTVCLSASNFVPATPVRFYPLQPLAGSQKT